jgi:hypothetical protein
LAFRGNHETHARRCCLFAAFSAVAYFDPERALADLGLAE